MQEAKYTITEDAKGQRFWRCELDGEESQPLPPNVSLRFYPNKTAIVDGKPIEHPQDLPLGTEVILRVPAQEQNTAQERKQRALVIVTRLREALKLNALRQGNLLSTEEADAFIKALVEEQMGKETTAKVLEGVQLGEAQAVIQTYLKQFGVDILDALAEGEGIER